MGGLILKVGGDASSGCRWWSGTSTSGAACRGCSVVFVALVVVMNYAFTRTKWGRSMIAVGGNAEAARRAGINVRRIYI